MSNVELSKESVEDLGTENVHESTPVSTPVCTQVVQPDVQAGLQPGVVITDMYRDLKVYCCADGNTDPDVQSIRGIIKTEDTTVCKSFGFIPEVVSTKEEDCKTFIEPLCKVEGTKYFNSIEGSILRLWQFNGDWYLSTHRKIDSFKSKWGHDHASYGELFCNALLPIIKSKLHLSWADDEDDSDTSVETSSDEEERHKSSYPPFIVSHKKLREQPYCRYTSQLNPESIYVFCLTTFKENRVVSQGDTTPHLYCVGVFDRSNQFSFKYYSPEVLVPSPEEVTFESNELQTIQNYVSSIDIKKYQGVIVMTPTGQSAKMVNPEYDRLLKLRGNVPNVIHRYVQLRWKPEELKEYKELYPEHQEKFNKWEEIYTHILHNIMRKYIERYVKHRTAILPPEQYEVLIQVHDEFCKHLRLKGERVTIDVINRILGSWEERAVNVLINKYKERQLISGNGNRMPDTMRDGILKTITIEKTFEKTSSKSATDTATDTTTDSATDTATTNESDIKSDIKTKVNSETIKDKLSSNPNFRSVKTNQQIETEKKVRSEERRVKRNTPKLSKISLIARTASASTTSTASSSASASS